MAYGINIFLVSEEVGNSIDFQNFNYSPVNEGFYIGHVILMLVVDSILYFFLYL